MSPHTSCSCGSQGGGDGVLASGPSDVPCGPATVTSCIYWCHFCFVAFCKCLLTCVRACVCARASDGALVLVENMAATSRRRGGVPERLTGRFSRVPQDAAVWKGNGDLPVTRP